MSTKIFKKRVKSLISKLNDAKVELEMIEKEYDNQIPVKIKIHVVELEDKIKDIETQLRFLQ